MSGTSLAQASDPVRVVCPEHLVLRPDGQASAMLGIRSLRIYAGRPTGCVLGIGMGLGLYDSNHSAAETCRGACLVPTGLRFETLP